MKTPTILALIAAAFFLAGHAPAQTLDDANRAFAAGHYQESTQSFQAILTRDGYSAPVLFDLGNSYYCEGDFARAILTYKRAQWLTPNDPDIAANLRLAQKQAGLIVDEPRSIDRFSSMLSPSGWAWLGCGAWVLLCASLLGRTILPARRSLFFQAGTACVLVLVTAIGAIVMTSGQLQQAVVIDKNASALISPFPDAQTVFSPAPGETLQIEKAYNDFILVKDVKGHTGWISNKQLSPVIPLDQADSTRSG